VGVGSLLRSRGALLWKERFSEAEGIEVAVAITRLAKHDEEYFAFCSLCQELISHFIRLI
jgi:hypothetical protein